MKIQSLKFTANPGDSHPLQTDLGIGSPQEFEKLRDGTLPVAYLVIKEHLTTIYGFNDLVINRGTKNKGKGLFDYFSEMNNDKILVIDVNYDQGGRLASGIKKLLFNASENKKRNVFIIGAEKKLFKELWDRAENTEKAEAKKKSGAVAKDTPRGSEQCDPATARIFDLVHDHSDKSDKLANVYIGCSDEAKLVRNLILKASMVDDPVMILGDTGTGKEIIANQIHECGQKGGKFKVINCGGITETLFESELFGYKKGAFTDAREHRAGLWVEAQDGTLFLDEIGDLPLSQQVKILRVLSTGTIRRVGDTDDIEVTARVVTATNRNLSSMVQSGQFREDLYYRLRGFLITTSPLRKHPADIPLLAQHFWKNIMKDNSCSLPEEILDELQSYLWPGNAKELDMVLKNLHALYLEESKEGRLKVAHLKAVFYLQGQSAVITDGPVTEQEVPMYRAECLRHLKRVNEVVHATRVTILSGIEGSRLDRSIETVNRLLGLRLLELENLCTKPSLFDSEPTFSTVYKLVGKLKYFQDLLLEDGKKARRYWNKDVMEEIKVVISTVFREIERVLGKG
ncbi:MAG: sigma 54-interacting transcriptional regulator [Dissulfurispiraceae bacterium]